MFREWLQAHDLSRVKLDGAVLPTAADRAAWEKTDASVFTQAAEALCGYDWPTIKATDFMAFLRTGNRLIMEDKHFARRHAFNTLVTAEVCEHKGRFMDDIINGLMAICEESYWGLSAHYLGEVRMIPDAIHPYIDLFAGDTASNLTLCLHVLEVELAAVTPEIVLRVRYELDRRIVQPFLSHEDFHWMGYRRPVNNWNPWILSNIITVALLGVTDRVTRQEMLQKALFLLDNYMATVPADGGCDEGMNYWNVAGLAVFDAIYQLYLASNGEIDFFTEPTIRRIGDFPCKVYIGNGWTANFADGPAHLPRPGFGGGMLYLFGKMTGNPRLMGLGYDVGMETLSRATLKQNNLRRILMSTVSPAEPCAFEPEAHSVLENLQIATTRTKHFTAVIKGGHNAEGHNHNDVGTFILFGTDPILIDAGVGVYTRQTFSSERYSIWTMQSSWHNLPEVNGKMQPSGGRFRATDFSSDSTATTLNLTEAYPPKTGLSRLIRCLEVSDERVTLTDAFTFTSEENTVVEHFMLATKPIVEEGYICIGNYKLTAPAGFSVEVDQKSIREDRSLYGVWGTDALYRLRISGRCGTHTKLIFTITERNHL